MTTSRYIKKVQLTEVEAKRFHKEVEQFCKTVRERTEKDAQKGAFRKDWSEAWGGRLLENLTSPGVYVYKDITSFINADDWLFRIIEKEEDIHYFKDDIFLNSALLIYDRKEPLKPTCRIRINELHEVIWAAYRALKKRSSSEPTSGEVWLELKRNYEEYDTEEVIQEIKKGTIYWTNYKGNGNELKENSFRVTLCHIKKKRNISKNSN